MEAARNVDYYWKRGYTDTILEFIAVRVAERNCRHEYNLANSSQLQDSMNVERYVLN